MGVYADPNGVEIHFYDKEGKKEIRNSIQGKGKLFSLHRADRRNQPDPISPDYSLGSPDWLTDVMIADNDHDLQKMTASSDGACLTSTCSQMVLVQWNVEPSPGKIDSGQMENCVTLAVVDSSDPNPRERLPTKEIYVFPEGTKIVEGHPFYNRWQKTIDYFQSIHRTVDTRP